MSDTSRYVPFQIPDPKNVAIRPLNGGMVCDMAADAITPGQFLVVQNYHPTLRGLKRRPGFSYFGPNSSQVSSADWPLLDAAPLWSLTGSNSAALITARYLYALSGTSAPSQKYWTYTTGTVSVSGATATGSGTAWATAASQLMAGDLFVANNTEYTITNITSDTSLLIDIRYENRSFSSNGIKTTISGPVVLLGLREYM